MYLKNYYKILQVSPHAEQEVIDAAYKRLALKYHPDQNKSRDANKRMLEINEAYEVLRDPVERNNYDHNYSHLWDNQKIFEVAEAERVRREQAEAREKEARVQADTERKRRIEAEELISFLKREEDSKAANGARKNDEKKHHQKITVLFASTIFVALFIYISINNNIWPVGIKTHEPQNSSTPLPTITFEEIIVSEPQPDLKPTSVPSVHDEYKQSMIDIISDYQICISNIQDVTQSSEALSIFMDEQLFERHIQGNITKVKLLQAKMDSLSPPDHLIDTHKEITGMFYHFTHAMILLEKWSKTRSQDSLLDQVAAEIQTFDQELNNIGSIADLITVVNTETTEED